MTTQQQTQEHPQDLAVTVGELKGIVQMLVELQRANTEAIAATNTRIDNLQTDINARFAEVNARFDTINARFDAVNVRFDALHADNRRTFLATLGGSFLISGVLATGLTTLILRIT